MACPKGHPKGWELSVEDMTQNTRPGQGLPSPRRAWKAGPGQEQDPAEKKARPKGRPEGWELSVERVAQNTRPGQGLPARSKP